MICIRNCLIISIRNRLMMCIRNHLMMCIRNILMMCIGNCLMMCIRNRLLMCIRNRLMMYIRNRLLMCIRNRLLMCIRNRLMMYIRNRLLMCIRNRLLMCIRNRLMICIQNRFQQILPRQSLITIYKSFIRPYLDYGDIAYDRAFNESFHKYLESINYNAAIAITGAIRGTSSEKLFQELGLEYLKSRRWVRKLCLFYKIFHKESPSYLFQLIRPNNKVYATRSSQSKKFSSFKTRHNFFEDSFFPAVISEWNSLNIDTRNSSFINVFKKELLNFIRPERNSTYNINDTKGLKLLTRLRLGLSHLGDHKFRRNFQDCVIVVRILKQQLTSSFTAPIIIVQGKPSLTR